MESSAEAQNRRHGTSSVKDSAKMTHYRDRLSGVVRFRRRSSSERLQGCLPPQNSLDTHHVDGYPYNK